MGQANKIGPQSFGPPEQRGRVLAAVGASATKGRLFMYAHTAQENGPAVEQNLRASGFNTAEANLVRHVIGFSFDYHIGEFGIVRRPQGEIGIEINLRRSVRIRRKGLADPRFGNSDGDSLSELVSVKSHPAGHAIPRAFLNLA